MDGTEKRTTSLVLLFAAMFLASAPAVAGGLRWGGESHGGSGRSHQTWSGGMGSHGSSPHHEPRSGASSHGRATPRAHGPRHHDRHGGTHHDRHEGTHWSPEEGWHSGRHHGKHSGTHHDWHDRSHHFERKHGSGFRFGSRRHGFSFGFHGHESRSSFGSSFGSAGPPPLGAGRAPVVFISTPFFCHPHGLGFTDEREFVRHLNEDHGLPEGNALAYCRPVGGKLFFFGF